MDEKLRKSIILEHYSNPLNKGLLNDNSYEKINMNSPTCIDNLDFEIKIENDIVTDIKYDGEACAISTSSSSIMTDLIIGKSVEEAKEIIDNFYAMINEEKYDEEILGEANCYCEIYKQPNRKKCALLPYEGLKKVIDKNK